MKKHETVLNLTVSIHKGSASEFTVTRRETSLTLSPDTRLSAVAEFERTAAAHVKEARRAARQGHFVFVDVSKARYTFTDCTDLHQDAFEMWSGHGDSITGDGVHLTPCEQYNEDLCHDMWLTGDRGKIFEEMTV